MTTGQLELFEVDLPVNNLIYSTYQHFPYQPWDAFAELIDNATQSFFDHEKELNGKLHIAVEYERIDGIADKITVYDDAFGMDEKTVRRAVRLAERPPDTTGRCEFGMGMKTSCCWFGNKWTLTTKQLGHPYEYVLEMDVDAFANSASTKLVVSKRKAAEPDHYTRIEVTGLHREFKTRTLGKIKERIALAYQRDMASGRVDIRFNGSSLEPKLPELMIKDGVPVKRPIDFSIEGHRITGWVGLLAQRKGSSFAGFNIFRRGRLIMPNQKFYGPGLFPDVSTNVIHQRMTGELDLDTLPAVHLKNAIDLRNLQEPFEAALAEQIKDVRADAIKLKYSEIAPDQKLANVADAVESVLSKDDVIEQIQVADDLREIDLPAPPSPADPQIGREPYLTKVLPIRGGLRLRVYLTADDPIRLYMTYSGAVTATGLDIEINTSHPWIADADDVSFDMFVEMAVLEAIAEWLSDRGEHNPALARKARQLKDQLMRSSEMQFNSVT